MPYQGWEKQYAFLNSADLADPIFVIHNEASGASIFEDRQRMFGIFYAAIGSRVFQDHESETIQEYVYTWERVVSMIECCHRLREIMDEKQFSYHYLGNVTPK